MVIFITAVLADVAPAPAANPGPLAGLFFVGLGVSVYFLWRNMNKQLKKIEPNKNPELNDK